MRDSVVSDLGFTMSNQNRLGTAIRSDRFTLVEFTNLPSAFYDRRQDPFEQVNLLDGVMTMVQESGYTSLLEALETL